MDPLAEIDRLRRLTLASVWVSGVVTVAYFGIVVYVAIKASRNSHLLRRYPGSTRWKVITRLDNDWEGLVEPAHREPFRRGRRYARAVLVALLAYATINGGLKAIRAHWLAQVGELTVGPGASDEGRR